MAVGQAGPVVEERRSRLVAVGILHAGAAAAAASWEQLLAAAAVGIAEGFPVGAGSPGGNPGQTVPGSGLAGETAAAASWEQLLAAAAAVGSGMDQAVAGTDPGVVGPALAA